MKLVEILAREMDEWPELATAARQRERMVIFYGDGSWVGCVKFSEAATDQDTAIVTRAMWEAERARITTTRMDIVTESACGEHRYRTPCTVIGEYEGRMVVVEDGENKPRFVDRERLHPHMTAEQLAAEDREQAITDLMQTACIRRGDAARIYDAGYRRQ